MVANLNTAVIYRHILTQESVRALVNYCSIFITFAHGGKLKYRSNLPEHKDFLGLKYDCKLPQYLSLHRVPILLNFSSW
jgi:hypothetical protein